VSRENLEIVRALGEAFRRRDHERPFDFYDPDIEWDASGMVSRAPGAMGVYRGHEGVRTFWREWLSAWKDVAFEIEDVRAAGDEVVMLVRNQRMWGRHTGIATGVPPYAMVFTFQDGKIVRWRASRPRIGARGSRAPCYRAELSLRVARCPPGRNRHRVRCFCNRLR
jgi:ketosteroid isomerase-like protein